MGIGNLLRSCFGVAAIVAAMAAVSRAADTTPAAAGSATASPAGAATAASDFRAERLSDSESLSARGIGFPVPPKILRYADRVFRKYDTKNDGQLDASEWEKMHGAPKLVDIDRSGTITPKELARYIYLYGRAHRLNLAVPVATSVERASARSVFRPASSMPLPEGADAPPADNGAPGASEAESETDNEEMSDEDAAEEQDASSQPVVVRSQNESSSSVRRKLIKSRKFYVPRAALPAGAPDWFRSRDYDGDGQISLAEFAPNPTREDRLEFHRYDLDGDGVITAKEASGRGGTPKPLTSAISPKSSAATSAYGSTTSKTSKGYGATTPAGAVPAGPAVTAYGSAPYKPYGATPPAYGGTPGKTYGTTPPSYGGSVKPSKSGTYGVPAGAYVPPR